MISGTSWKHDEKIMMMEWSISASSSHDSEIDKEQIFCQLIEFWILFGW